MPDRLIFARNGVDLRDGVELRNGKANTFGWSSYEVWLVEQFEAPVETRIADLYCGKVINLAEGITFRIEHGDG